MQMSTSTAINRLVAADRSGLYCALKSASWAASFRKVRKEIRFSGTRRFASRKRCGTVE